MAKEINTTEVPQSKSDSPLGKKNGRLKVKMSETSSIDPEQLKKEFADQGHSQWDKVVDWVQKNPKTAAFGGGVALVLLGRRRLTQIAKLGVSSGLFAWAFENLRKKA